MCPDIRRQEQPRDRWRADQIVEQLPFQGIAHRDKLVPRGGRCTTRWSAAGPDDFTEKRVDDQPTAVNIEKDLQSFKLLHTVHSNQLVA
jgi:hypothetical protein